MIIIVSMCFPLLKQRSSSRKSQNRGERGYVRLGAEDKRKEDIRRQNRTWRAKEGGKGREDDDADKYFEPFRLACGKSMPAKITSKSLSSTFLKTRRVFCFNKSHPIDMILILHPTLLLFARVDERR